MKQATLFNLGIPIGPGDALTVIEIKLKETERVANKRWLETLNEHDKQLMQLHRKLRHLLHCLNDRHDLRLEFIHYSRIPTWICKWCRTKMPTKPMWVVGGVFWFGIETDARGFVNSNADNLSNNKIVEYRGTSRGVHNG